MFSGCGGKISSNKTLINNANSKTDKLNRTLASPIRLKILFINRTNMYAKYIAAMVTPTG